MTESWPSCGSAWVRDEVERAVVGKRDALELVMLGLLADGHVLLDDYPGLAKADRPVVRPGPSLGFARVHFARPDAVGRDRLLDLQPALGRLRVPARAGVHQPAARDEINRSPPKTQAALLEAMQERQVTIDGVTRSLERPFLVMATQNPIEFEGTYPLPEAQLDRFLLRLSIGYPSPEAEWRMLERRLERTADEVELARVATPADVLAMQRAVEQVHVASSVGRYIVELVGATRASPGSRSAPAPGAAWPCSRWPGPRPPWPAVTSSPPRTSRRWPSPPWPTASSSARAVGAPVRTEDVVAELLEQVPTPPPQAEPAPVRTHRAGDSPPQRQDRRLRRGGRPGAAGRPRPGPARAGGGDRPAGRAGGGRPGRRPRPGWPPRSPWTGNGPWSGTR